MKSVYDYLTEKRLINKSVTKELPKVTKEELRDMILKGEDIDTVDYSHITDMRRIFYNCPKLTKLPENFDTSNVTNMRSMFDGCSELTKLPENFDTSKVTTMSYMFLGCYKLIEYYKNHLDEARRYKGLEEAFREVGVYV